jgi:hypothetical protein
MTNREKIVGFDRTIQYNWIDSAVEMMHKGLPPEQIWLDLDPIIGSVLTGIDARRKCKTVIFRTWIKVPKKDIQFRDEALQLIHDASPSERISVHWGMCCVAYTYFRDVASIIGKMLKFQDEINSQQLIRRVVEIYGERETAIRATQRLIVTLKNWQVIDEYLDKNIISRKNKQKLDLADKIQAWLIESLLRASGERSMATSMIQQHSSYFPFMLKPQPSILSLNKRLESGRNSGTEDVVWLRA